MAAALVDDTILRLYPWHGGPPIELAGPNQDHAGVILLEGLEGIWAAPITPVKIVTARTPGSIPVTVRVEERIVHLATMVTGDDSYSWQVWTRNMWRALSPTRDSLLVASTLVSGPRWLPVRRHATPDDQIVEDPTFSRAQIWNWQLVAHDPDWRSPDLTGDWINTGGTGVGVLRAAVRGDRPSYVTWTGNAGDWILQGPDGLWHPLPSMAAGEEWTANSHPMSFQLQSTLDRDKWRLLKRGWTSPAPVESELALGVRVVGSSAARVQLRVQQRWEHPW